MAKIGFGKTKQVIGITGSYSIAQFASPPLTLTLLAKHDANLGIVVDMGHELRPIVEAVANSLEN
nr:hypothetical protein HK105_003355 [Polyrhizophydium stewartii]